MLSSSGWDRLAGRRWAIRKRRMHILGREVPKVPSGLHHAGLAKRNLPRMLEWPASGVLDGAEIVWIPRLGEADDPAIRIPLDAGGAGRGDGCPATAAIRLGRRIHRERTWHRLGLRRKAHDGGVGIAGYGKGGVGAGNRVECWASHRGRGWWRDGRGQGCGARTCRERTQSPQERDDAAHRQPRSVAQISRDGTNG